MLVPLAGLAALTDLMPISFIVIVLLTLVITSYRQTIYAYPSGGGSYVVSRENLGETPSLVAGASLLVDYILTVAVSISAGVAAITSAFPELRPERVLICLGFVALMMFANLRGLKESGRLFAGPTYLYMIMIIGLIGIGLFRYFTGSIEALPPNTEELNELTDNGLLLTGITAMAFLRAFSSGAVALTGIEAISNGVPAFKKPESRNAATTLIVMGVILGSFFLGLSVLANLLKPTVSENETLLSIMGSAVFGDGTRALLRAAVRHVRHPDPRRQHRVRRLPTRQLDPGQRRLPAPPARQPRRPARVLQRHHRPRRRGQPADHRVRRPDERPDPAVRRRRVLRVHALPARHGRAPQAAAGARLEAQPGHQHDRRDRHVHRADRGGRVEVQPRRLDPGRADPAHRARVPQDQAPLRPRRVGTEGRADRAGRPPLPHRRRAHRIGEQGRAQRRRVRAIDAPRPARRDQCRDRRRGGTARRRRLGAVRAAGRAAHRVLRLSRPDQSDPRGHRRARCRTPRRRDHRGDPRVRRRALVGPGAAQPERRRAALEAAPAPEHRHHPDPGADRPPASPTPPVPEVAT